MRSKIMYLVKTTTYLIKAKIYKNKYTNNTILGKNHSIGIPGES
jgi:hypothetical protein